MNKPGFDLLAIEPLRLLRASRLAGKRRMSPYVWRVSPGHFAMLFRILDKGVAAPSSLWLAHGNGLTFTLDPQPVLKPGPEEYDIKGCEDPTVVHVDQGCLVYYTGVNSEGVAQLLYAEGRDIRSLTKRGVAHASTAADRNTKEASVERRGEDWILLFEYSSNGHSHVGRGEAENPAGPWRESSDPLKVRKGSWDNWHLSTGPLLIGEPGGPIMFYNGADADAVWQVGWTQLQSSLARVTRRCEKPLVGAPTHPGPAGRQISFAASVVDQEDVLWLYITHDDRSLRRAVIRRSRA